MNLHAIAAPFVGIVNPPVTGSWWQNSGYTTDDSGKREPILTEVTGVSFQVQALTGPELERLDGLNIQGVKRAVYMNGLPNAVDRTDDAGGDLFDFSGATWLVVGILECWGSGDDAWSRVAVVKQLDA